MWSAPYNHNHYKNKFGYKISGKLACQEIFDGIYYQPHKKS